MIIRKILNRLLAPAGMEVRAKPPVSAGATMAGLLHRLQARGAEFGTVVDVGAAAGHWTRRALPLFPTAQFLLLEPLEERRAELDALHAEEPRAHFTIAAAGEHEGEVTLSVSEDLDGSGIYERPSDPAARLVRLTTLDAEVRRLGLPGPYLVKLDTHGFEVPILAGAREVLAQTDALVVEVYNFKNSPACLRFHELCAHLETLGFRCADLADAMLRPGDQILWQMDLLFLRQTAACFQQGNYRAA